MNKPSVDQWQNIAFTAVVAIVCVLLYLLMGKAELAAEDSPAPSTPEATAYGPYEEQTPEPDRAPSFQPTPGYIFERLLLSEGTFRVKKIKGQERSFSLVCGSEVSGKAQLSYTLAEDGETMTSITFSFVARDKPPTKPKTDIERFLRDDYSSHIAQQNQAVEIMLPTCLELSDLNGRLIAPILQAWYTGALNARDENKTYTDTYAGCTFSAYASMDGGDDVVVCTLIFP